MLTASIGKSDNSRRGTTTVEFAIVCPLVFTFFFAAVEFARSNQIMNATSNAAYQGCRASIVPGATASGVIAEAKKYLDAGLISNATITVNPSTITNTTATVTVTVAVPLSNNMWIGPSFTGGKTVTRSCTLTREKTN
ncbi:MAG: pilus assembly protein [Planctomycetales bacterium]|nr:pilus assembly protein [Planctomycetales bacterium]MBN8629023.1 pilus assembly protein [Planctomycetota bacterium]